MVKLWLVNKVCFPITIEKRDFLPKMDFLLGGSTVVVVAVIYHIWTRQQKLEARLNNISQQIGQITNNQKHQNSIESRQDTRRLIHQGATTQTKVCGATKSVMDCATSYQKNQIQLEAYEASRQKLLRQ